MNKVVVRATGGQWSPLIKEIETITHFFLTYFKKENVSIDVILVSTKIMSSINKKTRNIEGPTDVLTFRVEDIDSSLRTYFNLSENKEEKDSYTALGEIYLAPQYIRKNKGEVRYLLIHGLLHILGYDHVEKDDRMRMEYEEKILCDVLDITRVF